MSTTGAGYSDEPFASKDGLRRRRGVERGRAVGICFPGRASRDGEDIVLLAPVSDSGEDGAHDVIAIWRV